MIIVLRRCLRRSAIAITAKTLVGNATISSGPAQPSGLRRRNVSLHFWRGRGYGANLKRKFQRHSVSLHRAACISTAASRGHVHKGAV